MTTRKKTTDAKQATAQVNPIVAKAAASIRKTRKGSAETEQLPLFPLPKENR
ncbi:hypothetical protein [Nocardia tengchongensis]|uniref:hypothetical protein n=1 Tax=Nocardia tengchongensis TaxID=2055889 RepID=UPI0036679FE5